MQQEVIENDKKNEKNILYKRTLHLQFCHYTSKYDKISKVGHQEANIYKYHLRVW